MNQKNPGSCPINHEGAERAASSIPGPARRLLFRIVGGASVAAGIIGIVVPLWPTTCFLLLAGWCFARSSPRAEAWLYRNRLFGRYLSAYRERGVISYRVRRGALMVLWVSIGLSAVLFARQLWILALLLLVAVAVSAHLMSLRREEPPSTNQTRPGQSGGAGRARSRISA
ncbi:MAG: YbaN family protein [Gemmatimonadetes bacterium]|nr:YbaN family protein [Gemmatimonadota bacterium]